MTVWLVALIGGALVVTSGEPDPITAILNRDWAAVGGWSLLFGFLVVWVGFGSFREWWVPGPRYRRIEEQLLKSVELNKVLAQQNADLIQANEITKHFFQEYTPRRTASSSRRRETDTGGDSE